ncbi:odorant receptor 13a-like [Frieseomelitta varia]|uniref:odorant receptor 13a-like n=1 Tax=Frieseomelitta varia TaxID=561572 RepID=UPI001CB69D6F|nr:odorant receptor 13a-like [Frieseomelitta varia]
MEKMTRMQNGEEDMKHIFRVVHPLLNALGAWPTDVRSPALSKITNIIHIVLIYFIEFAVIAPALLYTFLFVKNTSIRIKLIMPHLTHLCQLCKYTFVLWRHNEIRELLNDIRNDCLNATEDDQWIYKTRATIGHRLMMSLIICLFIGGALYLTVTPFLREKVVLPDNTTIRPLPSPSYFVLFSDQITPNYETIFFIQVFCGFISFTIYAGALGLCTTLCLHMCSMLKILGNKMRDLSGLSETDKDIVQEEIADIVEYHTKIRRFFNRSEHVTSYIYFVGITSEVIIMLIVGYIIIMEWGSSNATAIVTYFALQITMIIGMFMTCFVGQLLIDEGNVVKKISNTLDWYQLPVEKARCLILIIIMSNNPIKITVANMVQLSLITFIDIMKATLGYFNVLRSTI